ncbi:MAG TPA: heavy metal translocating P-type ATPase metal-binding domain-containing protein [Cytophagaceae bacterium]
MATEVLEAVKCYHCGSECEQQVLVYDEKSFCCDGCKSVYQLLSENNLCNYYDLTSNPGKKISGLGNRFEYLDDEDIKNELIAFRTREMSKISFNIPDMHCSSCIYLLENLSRINKGIITSTVDFLKKEIHITFNEQIISLRETAELLAGLGYLPEVKLNRAEEEVKKKKNKTLLYKIAIAGFSAGNIMLFSFPEYLSVFDKVDIEIQNFLGIISLILALPVTLYCASDYHISAFKAIRRGMLNIDLPISFGMLANTTKSAFDILTFTGPGYFDSITGLIFFLLIGKWFQNKTFESLSFEKDYKYYFPVAVTKIKDGQEVSVPLKNVKTGDTLLIRNQELIPADAVLLNGVANIDYSFVTGESVPVTGERGTKLFAGGRQLGPAIEVSVLKEVAESYLVQLWNQELYVKKEKNKIKRFTDFIGKYFVLLVLIISVATFVYWIRIDTNLAFKALTSVLIIACPCTLALAIPFAFGNGLRTLGTKGMFLKNAEVIGKLADADTIVFDKTGTITETDAADIQYEGMEMTSHEISLLKTALKNSTHPFSKLIYQSIQGAEYGKVESYKEIVSAGFEAMVENNRIKVGSATFVTGLPSEKNGLTSRVYISVNDQVKGYYSIKNKYREGITDMIRSLAGKYELHLISGDQESEKETLNKLFDSKVKLNFNQSPTDKLNYIKSLQAEGKKVLMIGDGLNDTGALKQSNVGISVTDKEYNFFPSCDTIIQAKDLYKLSNLLKYCKKSYWVVVASLIISLLYNIFAIGYAVTALLTPLVAAILMPVSSIAVVLFVVGGTNYFRNKLL